MASSESKVPSTALTNPFAEPGQGFCELLLVRHGEQAYRENMTVGEGIDAPLSELGRKQAAAVGERLAPLRVDAVYASPYQRALDTGRAIAEHHGTEPTVIDDLREVDLWGELPPDQGLLDSVGRDELRAIFARVKQDRTWDAYPYGEGTDAFRNRVRAAFDGIIADHHGDRVVVACHGGVIATVLAMAMDSRHDYGVSVHHTSITTLRAADERRLIHSVNDYHHVLGFQTALNPLNLH
ncbi:MAG TPA: histidine phosphatase family protein [Acidimicrobiales bacterium]|nr:histidine phosphatase family protein [Acidimicrobiales bacterium]